MDGTEGNEAPCYARVRLFNRSASVAGSVSFLNEGDARSNSPKDVGLRGSFEHRFIREIRADGRLRSGREEGQVGSEDGDRQAGLTEAVPEELEPEPALESVADQLRWHETTAAPRRDRTLVDSEVGRRAREGGSGDVAEELEGRKREVACGTADCVGDGLMNAAELGGGDGLGAVRQCGERRGVEHPEVARCEDLVVLDILGFNRVSLKLWWRANSNADVRVRADMRVRSDAGAGKHAHVV